MSVLFQSSTYNRTFIMVSSSDHISPLTGASPVVLLSKGGSAFAAAAGTVSEIGNGWYNVALTTADTNTVGELSYHCTATGGDDSDFADQVVAGLPVPTPPSLPQLTCGPVTFNYGTWVAMYPLFATLTQEQGVAYFNLATLICANSSTNPINRDGNLAALLYLLTCHFAWLNCPKDPSGNPAATGSAASPLVGRISNATEGSVSVATEWNAGSGSDLEAFLTQTQWGAAYWAATAQYRTARYLARPTRVINGLGFGLGRGLWT